MATHQQTLTEAQDWLIRPGRAGDIDRIAELWDEFDRNGPIEGLGMKLLKVSTDPSHKNYDYNRTFCATLSSGEVVGFGIGIISSRELIANAYDCPGIEHRFDSSKNGDLHLACVDPEYRGRGIGTALMRRRLTYFRNNGVRKAFGVSWVRPDDGPSSRPVFERCGFSPITTVENFYQSESGDGVARHCPTCGGQCSCSARIYEKEVIGEIP